MPASLFIPLPAGYDRASLNRKLKGITQSIGGQAVVNPKDAAFGAKGDAVETPGGGWHGTNDTVAIQAAIVYASSLGGVVAFPPGVYMSSQIIVYRNVMLDGGTPGAVELRQIAGTNTDFIISENFPALTGSGLNHVTSALVPSWFGLKDLRINGNAASPNNSEPSPNTSGRGIAFYGNAQRMLGIVNVEMTADDAIYTEGPSASASGVWPGQEEGIFDTVIVREPGGHGWLFRGPNDSRINSYFCVMYEGTGYGFQNESGANFAGNLNEIGDLHVYSLGTQKTGINVQAPLIASQFQGDDVTIIINAFAMIDKLIFLNNSHVTGVSVSADNVIINSLITNIVGATVTGRTAVLWSGSMGTVGACQILGDASSAGEIGLHNTGAWNQFRNILINNNTGTGGIGIKSRTNDYAVYEGIIERCKTGLDYDGTGRIHAVLDVYTDTGQVPVNNGTLPNATDRFDVRSVGAVTGFTDVRVVSSNAVDMTSTAVQTITLAHTCLYTPVKRNVALTFSTPTVTDWAWDQSPYFVSADATNLTIKCKLRTASGTGGSKGDVMAHIRMGA